MSVPFSACEDGNNNVVMKGFENNKEEDFTQFWGSINDSLPVPEFDESIWAEAAMSLDNPIMYDAAIYAPATLADVAPWDNLQTPWCM